MNAAVVCVGRLREKFYADAAQEYLKRLSRFGKMDLIEVPDLPEPANASDADRARVMDREGYQILSRIRPGDRVIALCVDAPQYSSEAFARRLQEWEMLSGARQVFVIGGSLGLSPAVLQRADEKISFSKMTFPHQLARVILLEQVYRACKINAGEKYHK